MMGKLINLLKINYLLPSAFLLTGLIAMSCSKNTAVPEPEKKDSIPDVTVNPPTTGDTSDVVGKVVVGYQGWFATEGDGFMNSWIHWGDTNKVFFELWPDTREYSTTYQTNFDNLGNGQPAKLFSSTDGSTIQTHFKWMKDYEIDCAAIQRFGSRLATDANNKKQKDSILAKAARSAVANNVKFYVMYDISGWTNFQSEIKTDWTNTINNQLNVTSSPAYAKHKGKPVVCIWGPTVPNRPGTPASVAEVIKWFHDQGCYVIVGVSRTWRGQPEFIPALMTADMISPWVVGTNRDDAGVDYYYNNLVKTDLDTCSKYNVAFQPVIFPGFSWYNLKFDPANPAARPALNEVPRRQGKLMWRHFYMNRKYNIPNAYIAMFDEYDEGTAIAKAAEDVSMIPAMPASYKYKFLTLDADGVHLSSDFYLRLTRDGRKMIKGTAPMVEAAPTPYQ